MSITKKASAGVAAIALTLGMSAGAANAEHTTQDGLVNVNIGDVTILQDVNVGVAADLIVQACGINVNAAVGILAVVDRVDQDGRTRTICRGTGDAEVSQN